MQSVEGILRDGTFIRVAPNLQTHQSHPDVQRSVELKNNMDDEEINEKLISTILSFKLIKF